MLRINCALSWLCTAHRAAASSSSTLSQNLESSTRASQSGPKCESNRVRTRFAIQVATCTPLVTWPIGTRATRSEEHTSELQSRLHLVCRLLLEKKKKSDIELLVVG